MTEKYIRLDDVMTIIARKHLFKDKTDFDKCVHAIAEQIKALQTVEAVPLSVIEKIKAEIENRRSEIKEVDEKSKTISMKGYVLGLDRALEIIDKAVKECDTVASYKQVKGDEE